MSLVHLLFILLVCVGCAWGRHHHARVHEFYLSLEEVVDHRPDGVSRPILTVNGTIPGPILRVTSGDTIIAHVTNRLGSMESSMHFHGMFQKGTPHMDGGDPVTQCAIPPGRTLTYTFDTTGQSGTFWYHSHTCTQYGDGMTGAFIIDNVKETYDYDEDHVLVITDWYHNMTASYLPYYLSSASQGSEPIPDSSLINGKGRANCTNALSRGVKHCDPASPLSRVSVSRGHVVRLRIINVSSIAMFNVSVDHHTMALIELDSTEIKRHDVSHIVVNVAQRASVLIKANDPLSVGQYWIRADMMQDALDSPSPQPYGRAILHYRDSTENNNSDNSNSTLEPSTQENEFIPSDSVDWVDLVPLHPVPAPGPVTYRMILDVDIAPNSHNISVPTINGITWAPLKGANTLQQIIMGKHTSSFPPSNHVITFTNLSSVVEVILNNYDGGEHPFHLHGHDVYILGRGPNGPYNETRDRHKLNVVDPIERDTVSVQGGGWLVFRFQPNNPGVWLFHCHITWHMEAGLAMILAVDPVAIRALYPKGIHSLPDHMDTFCNATTTSMSTTPTPEPHHL